MASERHFLKCPGCGANTPRGNFRRGALGERPLQALVCKHVGAPHGTNGGAVIWSRRPMDRDELTLVAKALGVGLEQIGERLEEDLPEPASAAEELQEIEDDDEADETMERWLKGAEEQLKYRRRVVEDERARRRLMRRATR